MEELLTAMDNHVGASLYLGVIVVAVTYNLGKILSITHNHFISKGCSDEK